MSIVQKEASNGSSEAMAFLEGISRFDWPVRLAERVNDFDTPGFGI